MSEDGPALLVVDDNEDNRYTLTHRLKRQGYENLTTAENGQEALDLLAQQPFDLVLLDIMMPVMNGYEVLEHIKSDMALNTDAEGAYALGEKVRTALAESSFILDDSLRPLRVTVSIGVAQFRGNRKRFFQKTDEALYRAKAEGKNCTVLDSDDADDLAKARE